MTRTQIMSESTSMKLLELNAILQLAMYTLDELENDSTNKSIPKEIRKSLESSKPLFKELEKIIKKKYEGMLKNVFSVDEDMIMTIVEAYQFNIDKFKGMGINDIVIVK